MRGKWDVSRESVLLLVNLLTDIVGPPAMFPLENLHQNLPWLLALGIIQLTIPYLTYSAAIRHVRALDAAIISFIEPVLNPIWVLIVMHEHASVRTLAGGSVVLSTSLIRSIFASRAGRSSIEPAL